MLTSPLYMYSSIARITCNFTSFITMWRSEPPESMNIFLKYGEHAANMTRWHGNDLPSSTARTMSVKVCRRKSSPNTFNMFRSQLCQRRQNSWFDWSASILFVQLLKKRRKKIGDTLLRACVRGMSNRRETLHFRISVWLNFARVIAIIYSRRNGRFSRDVGRKGTKDKIPSVYTVNASSSGLSPENSKDTSIWEINRRLHSRVMRAMPGSYLSMPVLFL